MFLAACFVLSGGKVVSAERDEGARVPACSWPVSMLGLPVWWSVDELGVWNESWVQALTQPFIYCEALGTGSQVFICKWGTLAGLF